ncbi:MAG: SA1320 family protein [Sarcina sp.]
MESTSHIASISYQIEVWLNEGKTFEEIENKIKNLQSPDENGKINFPTNLELVGAYSDELNGTSGCAFLDKNTGETIVGFAGTNFHGKFLDGLKDVGTDLGLVVGGYDKDHPRLAGLNKFMTDLEKAGCNITQTTGHSLGGALAAFAAIYYDIPSGVTYNGAPTHGLELPTQWLARYLEGTSMHKLENYKGIITRFVTDEDFLNNISNFGHANYVGNEHLFNNGMGHDMDFFLKGYEQGKISEILGAIKVEWNDLSPVQFDDGTVVSLNKNDLNVKNLWGENGQYSGNGVTITIDPTAFSNLSNNIKNMISSDLKWMVDVIESCETKNNDLKKTENDEINLSGNIADSLNEIGLIEVLRKIEASHGVLSEAGNVALLESLASCDASSVKSKLKGGGWYVGGKYVSSSYYDYLTGNIKKLQEAAEDLHYEVTRVDEFVSVDRYSGMPQAVYRYETLSVIGDAFVDVTNKLLVEAKEVFKGRGLRSGKEDGIVDAISEVIYVEEKNIKQLKSQFEIASSIASGISDNFDGMDNWLSKEQAAGNYEIEAVPDTYKAYLEESNIFDDVKDVIEAYDLQVEEATNELTQKVINDFEYLSERAMNKLNNIYEAINNFRTSINEMVALFDDEVTRTIYEETEMVGQNEFESKTTTTNHGCFKSFFPSSFVSYVEKANKDIFPVTVDLYEAIASINLYNSQFGYLNKYLNTNIEKAIYDAQDLISIVEAHNLMRVKLEVMQAEFVKVDNEIQNEFKGKSIEAYRIQIEEIIKALDYFSLMIGDCFGRNSA